MTIQDDVVAAIDAVDAKIDVVATVIDEHTVALADVRAKLDAAITAKDFTAVAAAATRLSEHVAALSAAADRMRAGDPVAPTPAPEPVTEPEA